MRLTRLFALAITTFLSVSAQAASDAANRLSQYLEKAQTMTARFSQLTLDGSGTRLQETAGTVCRAHHDTLYAALCIGQRQAQQAFPGITCW